MAHPNQLQFVKSVTDHLTDDYRPIKIIEIGSYDVNGSVRQFFPNSEYLGVDLIVGPGVDLVCEGDKVSEADGSYDISISCECFEHNPNWAATFTNMCRMTKNGGVVLFTCATTGRAEHGTTRTSPDSSPGTQALNWDYYKNLTEEDFEAIVDLKNLFSSYFFLVNKYSHDLYFFGYKGSTIADFPTSTDSLKNKCASDQSLLNKMIADRKRVEKFIPKRYRKFYRKRFERKNESTLRKLLKDF